MAKNSRVVDNLFEDAAPPKSRVVENLFENSPAKAPAPAVSEKSSPSISIAGDKVTEAPLLRGLKETAIAGPVAPGFGELQAAPGRAVLTVQDQFSNDPNFRMAGPVSINPFLPDTQNTIKNIAPELLKAFLGYTDPGVNIAKKALGPAADLPAFLKTQAAGPIGSIYDILDKAGITKSEYSTMKLGESPVTTLLGQQLDVMASPNVYNLITWPLKVRYKLAAEIFNEIGARVKNSKGKVVVDEGQFMRWAESKSPNDLNQILKDIRAGKYDKRGAVPTERGVTVPGSPDLNPQGSPSQRPAPGTPAPAQGAASPLVVDNLFDETAKTAAAAARTAGSFFRSSRVFPNADPALLKQLDDLEAKLDATKDIRARKALLDQSEQLFAKIRQQELSKTTGTPEEAPIETSPRILAMQDEALAKRREKAVKDLVQDWLRYADASDVLGAENAVFGEGAIKDYPGLKELTTDEKNDLARYLNRIRGSIDAANSPETAVAYEKQVQKTSDEAVAQILGQRAKEPEKPRESLPPAAAKAERQVERAKSQEDIESEERSKLEAWIRKRAKEYEAKAQYGGFDQALKRVSEELRGERGQVPKDILALAQYHLRSTLDQETGEVLSAASPDWPRTGTLYDFLDEQGNKDTLYDEADAEDLLRAKPKEQSFKKAKVNFGLPKEVTDEEAREVFFFDEGDTVESAILKGLRDEINQGEAGGRIYDEELGRYTGGYPSTFPDYFKNKGYSKAETLRIISLALDKQPMTERQKNILTDLVDGYIEQSQKRAQYHADQEAESQSLEGKGTEENVPSEEIQKQDQGPASTSRPQVLEKPAKYPAEKTTQTDDLATFEPGSQYDLPGMDKRGELKLEEDIAYGKKGGRKEAIDKISRDEREVAVSAPDGVTPVWKSALALKLKETGTLKFPAQKIKGPEDIAFAFKAMKNEAQEHFYVGAIKDGEIVGVELVSIGSINSALAPLMETLPVLQSHMADSFFLVHNHPSGILDPSKEDLQLTRAAVKSLGEAGFDFKGHVIINDTKFGFIDPDLGYTVQPHKEYSKTKDVSVFRKRNEWLKSKDSRAKITAPEDVYEIIKGVTLDDKQGLVAVLDSSHFVQSLSMIPQSSFDFPFLSKLASAHRGPKLIFSNSGLSPAQITRLSRDLDALNISILDSVDPISPTEFSSARTRGLIGEKGQDYAAAQRLGEKKLDSYGNEEIPEIPDDAPADVRREKEEVVLKTFSGFEQQMDFFDDIPPENPPILPKSIDINLLKDISNIKKGFLDIYRQFDHVFGDHYPEIKSVMLDRLDESRDDFITAQKQWIEALDDEVVKNLGIKKGSKESEAVQMYGEGKINDVELKAWFGEEKMEKIIAADRWFRSAYNQLLSEVNRSRARIYPGRPEKLVPHRAFYYRHFRDLRSNDKLGFGGLANIFDTPAQISSGLAGISPFTKPKTKWASFTQKRMGIKTEIDAVGGFLDYLPAAAYAVHIDPNIVRFRTLQKELKELTKDNPVLNGFISSLEYFSGDLAGKTNPFLDRFFIDFFNLGQVDGRKALRALTWVNSRIKRNLVLMNASSLLAQSFNIPVAVANAKHYMLLGIADTMAQTVKPSPDMAKSKFLNSRFASDMYDRFDVDMLKKPVKTALSFAGWAMGAADEIATRAIWNAFFEKGKAKKVPDPVKYADTMTRNTVAGRSIGEVPLGQKSKIFQLLAPFQLEVANLWWVLGDRYNKKDFAGIVAFALTVYVMNAMSEKAIGRRYAFDPINASLDALTGDKTVPQRLGRIAGEVLSNFPMGQTFAAVYPEYGFTVGDRKFPTRKQLFGQADPTRFGGGLIVASGIMDPLFKLAPPFGGAAIKRGIEGYKSAARGYVKVGKKYVPVETSKFNKFVGLVFGPYALPEMREYFDFSEQASQQKYMAKQN